ncbi:hypothetical protein A3709_07095 [Halioglobus sp. HI00S01]|nr:hypothetical protein A3709_07095 [Halioglobus sp. HI00S01]
MFDTLDGMPLLVVHGESSDILAKTCVSAMQARKPDLVYAKIPNRGHAPTLKEPASRLAIDEFLARLS